LKKIGFILVLGLFLVTAGCAGGNQADKGDDGSIPDGSASRAEQKIPEVDPDLVGVVKSIVGNEVVLALAEMPEMPEMPEMQASPDAAAPQGNNTGGPPEGGARPEAGQRPSMEDMSDEERQAMMEARQQGGEGARPDNMEPTAEMEISYTGEEVTLTIPVGISIASRGGAGEGLELSDLQKGDILSIWYKDGTSGASAVIESIKLVGQTSESGSYE
jgi:hypothetical protein